MSKVDFKEHNFQQMTIFGTKIWKCQKCKLEIDKDKWIELSWGNDIGLIKCRGGNYHLDTVKMKIVQHPNGYLFSVPASLSEQEVKDIIEATKGHGKVR